jgi:hypothetical protein
MRVILTFVNPWQRRAHYEEAQKPGKVRMNRGIREKIQKTSAPAHA